MKTVGGAGRGKAVIVLNSAEPPLIMRDTVYCLIASPETRAAIADRWTPSGWAAARPGCDAPARRRVHMARPRGSVSPPATGGTRSLPQACNAAGLHAGARCTRGKSQPGDAALRRPHNDQTARVTATE
ncbi:MAG TPA: hypothetical protein VGS19_19455 [Streptosporangiaceae bacterium]|nr:hypothetical protein [Streptosporangiaceae bacterium]